MRIRRIVKDDEKSLRQISKPVEYPYSTKDLEDARYLLDYLVFASDEDNAKEYNLRPGVGLAAPQIGINKRMVAVYIQNFDDNGDEIEPTQYILINPKIISRSARLAYLLGGEGCLSVDAEHKGYVPRSANITVKAYDLLQQKDIEVRFRGYEAIVVQHELDHLDGVLFYDHINKKDPFTKIEGALEL